MAEIVLGIGTSHTPMLNAPVEDWPRFIERDTRRALLDTQGRPATYDELLARAAPAIAALIEPARLAARHRAAQAALVRLGETIRRAELDALIVVGDDQDELFHDAHMPGLLVYYGETIRNVPPPPTAHPDWGWRARARYFEQAVPRDYPVAAALARHLIASLVEAEFDVAAAAALPEGEGEGHAFGFVHKRLMPEAVVPVVPVFINTYYAPNQPLPRRCFTFGQALRAAVDSYPPAARVGILASGGLSHFVVDERLDRRVLDGLGKAGGAALAALPRHLLNSGSSEIRNWICMAGATGHLDLRWSEYQPGYRTPAGTGTGLGFAILS